MDILISLLAFIVVIAVLVTVHEFGHFWVARRLGVKVIRFSIGFGKPLYTWHRPDDETEYCIAAIPLGGYVRMLDEREGPVDGHELHRAFNRKALWQRFAIVLAGPMFNFLLAILFYSLTFMIGVTGMKPIVGQVVPGSIADQGGFKRGDLIQKVADRPVRTWDEAFLDMMDASIAREDVLIEVVDEGRGHQQRALEFARVEGHIDRSELLSFIGMRPYQVEIPAVIGKVVPGGAAMKAGLLAGDQLIAADGTPIADWHAWVALIRKSPGKALTVSVRRGQQQIDVVVTPETEQDSDGGVFGRIGAAVSMPEDDIKALQTTVRYWPLKALWAAMTKTLDMTGLTLRMLYQMIFGDVSAKNLSGPISIASYAGESVGMGVVPFFQFIALISVSLGILNLLPVPVLDGGHLFLYLIEGVRGKSISLETEVFFQRIGMAAIFSLMIFAFYNDIARILN